MECLKFWNLREHFSWYNIRKTDYLIQFDVYSQVQPAPKLHVYGDVQIMFQSCFLRKRRKVHEHKEIGTPAWILKILKIGQDNLAKLSTDIHEEIDISWRSEKPKLENV